MKYGLCLTLSILTMVFLIPQKSVFAYEIKEMVAVLNSNLSRGDLEGFGKNLAKFSVDNVRYPNYDYTKLGNTATTSYKSISAFGKYVSHSTVKSVSCGDQISRVISVFFASSGQYFMDYWFFKPGNDWVFAASHMKGHGSNAEFTKQLTEALKAGC